MSDSALTLTSQKFTIPHIPELFDPNFLNVLLPPPASSNDVLMEESDKVQPVPTNAMMEALQRSANHTFTANGAPALSTTNSPTLDAFLGLHSWIKAPEIDVLLTNSWKEDPGLTLRLIWQLRSIHDGKAEKEGFYRRVQFCGRQNRKFIEFFFLQGLRLVIQKASPYGHC
ncbi:hypothetical protein D9757_005608 [Collybiopsis confluens]|uniref:DUF2828 domain-containing protein n=1 Tax=Collybiopsis confluens TaxID=2823264 RepID=A0A8H5HSV5_9AGAR|nr:hypothetical protein D9757_005608 [Collybiopsis confluens]